MRRTPARWALLGIAFLGAGFLIARQLSLTLTTWILQGSVVVFGIALVVVFQEDLRRLVELIAVRGLRRRARTPTPEATDTLIRADYIENLNAYLEALRTGCANSHIDYMTVDTSRPLDAVLREFFFQRQSTLNAPSASART